MHRSSARTRQALNRLCSFTASGSAGSWDRWAVGTEEAGFTALTPGWPDDPDTVAEANAHPEDGAQDRAGRRTFTNRGL